VSNIALVTSGLNVESGLVDPQTRFQQTLDSAASIKRHIPGAYVILLDGGKYPLTLAQRRALMAVYDDVMDFTYHPTVQFAHNQNVNVMYIKGPCESLMLHEACKLLPTDVSRVYKLSGRYEISDQFDQSVHNVPGKYVLKTREAGVRYYHDDKNNPGSQLQNIADYYTEYQYKTRLYSFCGSLLPTATENYQKLFQTMVGSYINHGFIDIEHSMYRVLDTNLIHEVPVIGVMGVQAENLVTLTE
jgi:hypothetical protein